MKHDEHDPHPLEATDADARKLRYVVSQYSGISQPQVQVPRPPVNSLLITNAASSPSPSVSGSPEYVGCESILPQTQEKDCRKIAEEEQKPTEEEEEEEGITGKMVLVIWTASNQTMFSFGEFRFNPMDH